MPNVASSLPLPLMLMLIYSSNCSTSTSSVGAGKLDEVRDEDGFCSKDKTTCSTHSSNIDTDRSGRIGLEFVLDVLAGDHGPDKIFFIETSGRDHLLSRQACAIEAAATQGQVRVVVVLSSNTLDLEANNATRQVYNNFKGLVTFVSWSPAGEDGLSLLKDTPLHNKRIWETIRNSKFHMAHTSDALRLALIYKHGGWYADIDTVIMKPLSKLVESHPGGTFYISSDQKNKFLIEEESNILGQEVANGFFGAMEHESKFIWRTMELFITGYRSNKWNVGGARPMTLALFEACDIEQPPEYLYSGGIFAPEKCQGITLLHPKTFYPYDWTMSTLLSNPETPEHWDEAFRDSYSIDMYATSGQGPPGSGPVTQIRFMKRRFYGAMIPAYVHLGPKFCPLAWESQKLF